MGNKKLTTFERIRECDRVIADLRRHLGIVEEERSRLLGIHRQECSHEMLCAKEFPGISNDGTAYTICPSCGKRDRIMENRSRGGYDIHAKSILWLPPEQFNAQFPEGKDAILLPDEIEALRTRSAV
jgi:hypothetical protein